MIFSAFSVEKLIPFDEKNSEAIWTASRSEPLINSGMPLPRAKRPQILSIRSSDQTADEGVLPTAEEQKKFGIKIVKLENTIHNDMWDGGSDEQKREINRIISDFLQNS